MIAFIKGTVFSVEPDALVLDKGGVGLMVLAPVSQFAKRPVIGEEVFLYTHLQVREDAWTLFGFAESEQLEIFRSLLSVSGIGAKTALAIINTLPVVGAVQRDNADAFGAVSGVGKKTAQRLVVDLKDKFAKWDSGAVIEGEVMPTIISQDGSDLLLALAGLGYNPTESRHLAAVAFKNVGQDADFNALMKEALRVAAKQ